MINKFIIQNKKNLITYDKKIAKKLNHWQKKIIKKEQTLYASRSKDKTNEMIIALNKKVLLHLIYIQITK